MKNIKNIIAAAVITLATLAASAQVNFYSNDILQTNFIINADGVVLGSTTNVVALNYANSLPDGYFNVSGIQGLNVPQYATFQVQTMQLPSGFFGSVWTNGGIAYSNGVTISALGGNATVLPQYATNLTLNFGTLLDDASKVLKLPASTNNVVSVVFTASSQTNGIQSWTVVTPLTNFYGAKWAKVISATYGGSNAIVLSHTRVGLSTVNR